MNLFLFKRQSHGQPQADQQLPLYSKLQQLKKPRTMSVKVNVLMGAIAFLLAGIISSCGPTGGATATVTPSPTLTPTPSPTPTPIPSPTPTPIMITITSPMDNSSVPVQILVEGTASGIPPNKELWLLVTAAGVAGYFPQNGPIVVSADEKWSASATLGGTGSKDVGRQFVLYTALVDQNDKEAKDAISNYFTVGKQTNNYVPINPLPAGIQTISQVTVVRK